MQTPFYELIHEMQRNEITEHHIYRMLSRAVKDEANRGILERLSREELRHYEFLRNITRRDVKPRWVKIWWFYLVSRIFGLTFGVKLMERGEKGAQETYSRIDLLGFQDLMRDEMEHERALIGMIDEERLRFIGAIVRGLNDALVELLGVLAGLTLTLATPLLIAVAGGITGVSASLSMAASEYLSVKAEGSENPVRAALYTGLAYFLTVLLLISPYLFSSNILLSLAIAIVNAVILIVVFNFYLSISLDVPFLKRLLEMLFIGLGVAALSFTMGFIANRWLGIGEM